MAGCCNCQEKALKLYKGYPSEFADVDWLSIVFESEPIDLTNFEAKFVLGDITREWGDITQGIIINLTDEETGSLPVGMNYGTLIVTDKDGNSKPFSTAIPIEVLTWVEGEQELDTYNMTINALLDNEVEMVIRIETAKVSLDWVLEKIAEHNASEEAHPYIQGLIDAEETARENADSALSDRITENTERFNNYRTSANQDIIDNAQNVEIGKKQDKLTSENAGVGISIEDVGGKVVISNTQTSAEWGNITGNIQDQQDLQDEFATKQDTLIAGENITIENNIISATGGGIPNLDGGSASSVYLVEQKADGGNAGDEVDNGDTNSD